MPLNIRENTVAEGSCLLDIPGTQGKAETFSRSIGFMDCDVAPPHTAIVPEMVVEVVIVYTKRDFSLLCHFRKCLFEVQDIALRTFRVRFGTALRHLRFLLCVDGHLKTPPRSKKD